MPWLGRVAARARVRRPGCDRAQAAGGGRSVTIYHLAVRLLGAVRRFALGRPRLRRHARPGGRTALLPGAPGRSGKGPSGACDSCYCCPSHCEMPHASVRCACGVPPGPCRHERRPSASCRSASCDSLHWDTCSLGQLRQLPVPAAALQRIGPSEGSQCESARSACKRDRAGVRTDDLRLCRPAP